MVTINWSGKIAVAFRLDPSQDDLLIRIFGGCCMIFFDQLLSHIRFSGWGNKG